jgi:ribose transport system permease protein
MPTPDRIVADPLPANPSVATASANVVGDASEQSATARGNPMDTAIQLGSRAGMIVVLIAIVIAARILYPGFLQWGNLDNLLSQNAPIGIIAVGMTYVMIAGGFDLSVGAIYSCGAVFFAEMAQQLPVGVALVLTLVLGIVLGAINGFLITRMRVNPFIATLGTSFIFGGAAFLYSHSAPVIVTKPGFQTLGQGSVAGLRTSIWIGAAIFLAGGVVLARSVYGQSLYAIGGNNEAARLAGLRVNRLRGSTYVIVGAIAALGGAILASRIGVGQADLGSNITLEVIAMVVIGGTSLFGGEGAVWRTFIGLLILAVISNVSDSLGWNSNVQNVVTGAIVIGAVALDAFARGRQT